MTDAGDKLIGAEQGALNIARGEQPAAVLHVDGWDYVPMHDLLSAQEDGRRLAGVARKLVKLLDDMETNHGGLIGAKTYRGRDELRLELSRWPK